MPGESRRTTTYSIAPGNRQQVREQLNRLGATDQPTGPYEAWRLKLSNQTSQALAILYTSGKLVLSGQAPLFDQAASAIEPVSQTMPRKPDPRHQNEASGSIPPETEAHIGTDEAGKGDFFGPMVTAAVFVDERTAQILRTLGVRDSKTVTDRALRGLATSVRQIVEQDKRAVLVLAPKRYNELYKQMRSEGKNLNTMLAWTHTRVIEDLIRNGLRPKFVLSDQFGDKRYIERRLLVDTRLSGVPVLQMHKAESDVAVAAASILARDGFLGWLDDASKQLGVTLPKGASGRVIETARRLVARDGADSLKESAKISFKTIEKVLAP